MPLYVRASGHRGWSVERELAHMHVCFTCLPYVSLLCLAYVSSLCVRARGSKSWSVKRARAGHISSFQTTALVSLSLSLSLSLCLCLSLSLSLSVSLLSVSLTICLPLWHLRVIKLTPYSLSLKCDFGSFKGTPSHSSVFCCFRTKFH